MHVPVYLVCAALILWVEGEEIRPYYRSKIEPLDLTNDKETSNLLTKLTAKYQPSNKWYDVIDPQFYVPTEMEINDIDYQKSKERSKRQGPSLSIVNSLDVLRNRLLLEMARKKQLEGIARNRNLLSSVGKRAAFRHKGNFEFENNAFYEN